jgi:hypothetical protein
MTCLLYALKGLLCRMPTKSMAKVSSVCSLASHSLCVKGAEYLCILDPTSSMRNAVLSSSLSCTNIRVIFIHRELSFFSSRRNWDSSYPSTAGECAPCPPVLGGGEHSLAREGLGESQFRRGDMHRGRGRGGILACG